MKKLCIFISMLVMLFFVPTTINQSFAAVDPTHPGFRVEGRFLYDNTGEKVILYGMNKMAIWMDKDGVPTFSEIAKTGANSVRITWGVSGTAEELDTVIRNCRAEHMIPIVELHDATGDWSKLPTLIDYWVKPEIVNVIKKHQEYLLVNIGNEVGDGNVSEATFKTDYEKYVKKMREAGIHVPLVIDASTWGQNINMLQACGPYLLSADPDKNLMFSAHLWWPYMYGHTDQEVINELTESANMNLPLVVGEFGHKWDETEQGKIPYKLIMEQCYKNQIGYLPWEWGPGNNPQTFLDMTSDSTFATLKDWGLEVCLTDTYSIKNIAKRPASMLSNLPPVLPQEPLPAGNLAFNKPVTASSTESTLYPGSNVVDGDLGTRWASTVSDPNWVSVDLGAKKDINKVIICWEAAFAAQYKIQVSDDANTWTDVYTQYNGKGKTEEISVTGSGRYLRVYCTQRTNYSWPYSIFELGVYGPESELSASISPTVAVFDKNAAKQSDLAITLNSKSNILESIKNGSSLLAAGTDYTVDGTTLTIKKEYLSAQPIGTTKLTLDYNGGVDPVFAVEIGDTSPSPNIKCSVITPTSAEFDSKSAKDLQITITPNGNTFIAIKNGSVALIPGADYTLSGNVITIDKRYLAAQTSGTLNLTFDFSNGTDPVLKITIIKSGIYGDANGDGIVNALDYAQLKMYLLSRVTLSSDTLKLVDLNQDNTVNALDLAILKKFLLGKVPSLPVVQ